MGLNSVFSEEEISIYHGGHSSNHDDEEEISIFFYRDEESNDAVSNDGVNPHDAVHTCFLLQRPTLD